MRVFRRITLIVSLCFVVVGIILMVCAAGLAGFDVKSVFTDDRKRNDVIVKEKFDSVTVETGIDSVSFIPSEDGSSLVEFYESPKSFYDVKVEDGTLKITYNENRKWYEFISFGSMSQHEVKVMIPAGEYKSISVNTGVGDINIPGDYHAESIAASSGIGNINAPKAEKSTSINTGIGDITVPEGEKSGKVDINTGIGDINIRKDDSTEKTEKNRISSESSGSTELNAGIGNITVPEGEASDSIETGIGKINRR